MSTVLVMGATGKIGSKVIEELLPAQANGDLQLIAGTRRPEAISEFQSKGIEARLIDLDLPEKHGLEPLVQSFMNTDVLLLITGYDTKMLAQSKAAIDAAKKAGVQHIVHIGAHAAPDTTIVHLGWHQMIEKYLEASGIAFTHIQPTAYMQNLMLLLAVGGAAPGILAHYIGEGSTSWVDSDDVARAAAIILQNPAQHAGKAYKLGTEIANMSEIADKLSRITDFTWQAEARDPQRFFEAVIAAGADQFYMACVRTIFERTAEGTLPDLSETFSTYRELTGSEPTSLEAFLQKHKQAFLPSKRAE